MNTCWDNCKKAAVTTGKKLCVSCFVLHGSARKSRYTIPYKEGLAHCLLSWFTCDKIEYWKTFYTEVCGKTFLHLNFTFFS